MKENTHLPTSASIAEVFPSFEISNSIVELGVTPVYSCTSIVSCQLGAKRARPTEFASLDNAIKSNFRGVGAEVRITRRNHRLGGVFFF